MTATTMVAPAVLPEPLAIVPADQVEGLIAAAHAELEGLAAELARTLAEADALEAEVGDAAFDPVSHEFVAVRLQRFLDGLRAEVNGDLDALMTTAADRRRRELTFSWAPLFEASVAPTACASPVAPVVAAVPVAVPPAPAPLETPVEAVPVPTLPVPTAVPTVPVPAAPDASPPVDLVVVDAPERVLEAEFWSDEPPRGAWRHVRRTVRTAGWQAAAVLLVIAAVLIRIG
jgi:hypothetical protein